MCLILDVLNEDGDSLYDLNVDQSVLEGQKTRQMALTNILLYELLEVDTLLILLAVDEEFG